MAVAEDRKRAAKSESLTIRLNPRTRFVLEFVARMRGQTITTVVERALEAAGDQAKIPNEYETDKGWRDFWDVSDGVRALKVAQEPELFPTYEEEKRLQFAKQFREYFFTDDECRSPNRVLTELLWPNIDELMSMHDDTKSKRYYAVESEMRKIIINAQVKPPKSRAGVKAPNEKGGYDLDDDIPF